MRKIPSTIKRHGYVSNVLTFRDPCIGTRTTTIAMFSSVYTISVSAQLGTSRITLQRRPAPPRSFDVARTPFSSPVVDVVIVKFYRQFSPSIYDSPFPALMISVFMCFRISSSLAAEAAFASYSLRKAVGSTRTELAAPIFFCCKMDAGSSTQRRYAVLRIPPPCQSVHGCAMHKQHSSRSRRYVVMSLCRYGLKMCGCIIYMSGCVDVDICDVCC